MVIRGHTVQIPLGDSSSCSVILQVPLLLKHIILESTVLGLKSSHRNLFILLMVYSVHTTSVACLSALRAPFIPR